MSRKWWTVIIVIAVVIGGFAAVKLMPLWATLVAVGSFAFGAFSGYILKKKDIIEKIVEKPVEVIREVIKEVVREVPVEKIVYKEVSTDNLFTTGEISTEEDPQVESKPKQRRRNRNRKVAE